MTEINQETMQEIYSTVEKQAEGDIEKLRTILITLLVTTLVGLSDDEVETQVMRIVTLADKNRKPEIKNVKAKAE